MVLLFEENRSDSEDDTAKSFNDLLQVFAFCIARIMHTSVIIIMKIQIVA